MDKGYAVFCIQFCYLKVKALCWPFQRFLEI